MPTKTISLRLGAYERLRRARLRPDESFSDVVMRAQWPGNAMTAGELREVYRTEGAHPDGGRAVRDRGGQDRRLARRASSGGSR